MDWWGKTQMATYWNSANTIEITSIKKPTTSYIKALLTGENYRWGGADISGGVNITYSIPGNLAGDPSTWASNYSSSKEPTAMKAIGQNVAAGFKSALQEWANVANITFTEVTDSTTVGDIRIAIFTKISASAGAWAYGPYTSAAGGDIWVNQKSINESSSFADGSYAKFALMHEIGHTLGLSHPLDNPRVSAYNNEKTIMSYNMHPSYPNTYTVTPMVYDIATIQYLYGANMSYHSGDDIYTFNTAGEAIKAIWDAGGTDSFSASNFTSAVTIDLRPGGYSSLGGKLNIGIAYNAVIENATGGSGKDTIIGNSAANIINGGGGIDTMKGGAGNDTYYVESVGDLVVETINNGTDTVISYLGSYSLPVNVENLILANGGTILKGFGNSLANTITGNEYDNTINGGGGADTMIGGLGNDTYTVDNTKDTITENSGEGTDTVIAYINNYTMPDNIENLVLANTSKVLKATGNASYNKITGNNYNNTLDGYEMIGGAGNDTYIVDSLSDIVTEISTGGLDTVVIYVNGYTLPAYVENLTLAETSTVSSGSGNGLNNTIRANNQADILTGGGGADQFVFKTVASSGVTITDFNTAQHDIINISAIDAKTSVVGNQTFTFIGTKSFSAKAGQLHIIQSGLDSLVQGDYSGDSIADFTITLIGVTANSIAASSFVL